MKDFSISKVKDYIEEHLKEPLRLDQIALEMGYSKYHLNRMFHEKTKQTIHHYIRERRLYEAADQLIDTDKPIVELALEMGYSSQQSFTFAFKKEFDCAPSVYRRERQETGLFVSGVVKMQGGLSLLAA